MPPEFTFTYLLPPVLLDQELSHAGRELVLRGINASAPQVFSTTRTRVWYVTGPFTKLGFFKQPRGFWQFPTPVFDFKRPMTGAVAVIADKATQQTLIAVGATPQPGTFNETEFRAVVESLTFEAEPVPDPTAGLPVQHSRGLFQISVDAGFLGGVVAFVGLGLVGLWAFPRFRPTALLDRPLLLAVLWAAFIGFTGFAGRLMGLALPSEATTIMFAGVLGQAYASRRARPMPPSLRFRTCACQFLIQALLVIGLVKWQHPHLNRVVAYGGSAVYLAVFLAASYWIMGLTGRLTLWWTTKGAQRGT